MQRSLEENKVYVHEIQVVVNKTESRLNDLKESSVSVSKAVSLAVEKQTNIEKEVKLSNEDIGKLKQHISNTDENIKNRLTKLAEYLKISEGNILARTSQLDTDIFKTEVEIGSMVDKVDEYSGKLGQFNSNVRELEIDVRNLQSQNTGLFQPINVCVVLAFVLIAVLFYMTYYRYDNDGTHQRTESHSTPPFMPQQILAFVKFQFHRLQMQLSQKILNIKHQRPSSILDMIHRVPVLDNKVCVLSFYSESMKLHRQLVESALATSNLEVILHLIRRHEDILTIPPARYIFVFVDFNTRNVILENPQDLGNKKLVAVQAAQKLGADVFVTYVRDRGSNQLVPGNLYNQELSAFTSHHVLRTLENKQRCFSVYETFNNTQKDSIVRSIS
ncbi:uncharacterized protein LOC143079076 isoform X2 [Mytilus galloprovincialis]|uniref:uncharacterized protein LOC143079076 isoform X2 n=1 Tax=Mytilus galloprovincialis TaxID=29158 RepID=UPI003F7BA2B3